MQTSGSAAIKKLIQLVKAALSDKVDSREVYMNGIDQSYYYESLSAFRAGDL